MGLAQLGRFLRSYEQGEHIVRQGDEATEFFILVEGIIGIYRDEAKVAQVSEPGAYVGGMAAILERPRTATMRCETPVHCYALPIDGFEKLIVSNPQIATKLVSSLATRLDRLMGKLGSFESISKPPAPGTPAPHTVKSNSLSVTWHA